MGDKELETMYIAMMFEELCNIRNKEIELYIIRRQCQEYPKIMRKKLFLNVDRNALADMKKQQKTHTRNNNLMMEETKKVIVGKMISLDKRKWNGIYTWRSCTEEWWETVAIHLRDEDKASACNCSLL